MFSAKGLGLALLCLIVAVIPALQSCQKDKAANVTDLLSTVPSSSGTVIGINLHSLLEKAGCKVEGSVITPGKELEKWISAQKEINDTEREAINMLLSGESGIDPVGAIYFTDAYNSYITAVLADTGKFTAFVEKQNGEPFEDAESNVKVNGNVAVSGAQMWVCTSTSGSIDAKAVKNYADLQENQSFLTTPNADAIGNLTHDVVGYSQLRGASKGLTIRDMATLNLLSGLLFDNASASSFHLDFLNGEIKAYALPLNDKGETAKYLLPADKIDVEKVKGLAQDANLVAAISIKKDLVKKLEKMGESLGGNMLAPFTKAFSSFDGTTAVAVGNLDNPDKSVSGIVTTDGNPSLDLMQLLSQFGGTQKNGNDVKVVQGTVNGELEVAKCADFLKGSTFGVVINANSAGLTGDQLGIKSIGFSLSPENGGVALNARAVTSDSGENALLTILKATAE